MWALLDIRTGKLGRLRFLALRVICEFFFRLFLLAVSSWFLRPNDSSALFTFAVVPHFIYLYLVLLLEVRRLRDMNVSVYFCLISIFTFLLVLSMDSILGAVAEHAPDLLGTWVTENTVGALFTPYFIYSLFLIFYKGGCAPEDEPRPEADSLKGLAVLQDPISSPDFKGRG